MADPLEGTTLGGCRIERRLGGGGMGVVYLAHHLRLDRPVALKLLAPELAAQPDFVAAFEREARAAARLEHPRIVQVYDAGRDQGRNFIIMQFVDGEPLLARLQREGRMNPMEALKVLKASLEGLSEAHRHGIIHRDIKPGNILLGRDGTIRLSDFGLAFAIKDPSIGAEKELLGTAEYMAPELGWGGKADERTDIYAMGAAYFEMLAGRPPYQGRTPADTLTMHLNHPLPDVRRENRDVPDMAARVLARMMAKDREKRYGSADEVLAEANAPGMLMDPGGFCGAERVLDLGLDLKKKQAPPPVPRPREHQEIRPVTGPVAKVPMPGVAAMDPAPAEAAKPPLDWKRPLAGLLLVVTAVLAYAAGRSGVWPLLGGAAAALGGACWLLKVKEADAWGITICAIGAGALFLSGRAGLPPYEPSWDWMRAQLVVLSLFAAGFPLWLASRLDRTPLLSALVSVGTLCGTAMLWLYAAPMLSLMKGEPAAFGQVGLALGIAAGVCALSTGIFDHFEARHGTPFMPIPLACAGLFLAVLSGGYYRIVPASQGTSAVEHWQRALALPFTGYVQGFFGYNGALVLGALLAALGTFLLLVKKEEAEEFGESFGDEG